MSSTQNDAIDPQFEKKIKNALEKGTNISLISYSMAEDTEKKLDKIIFFLLERYNQPDDLNTLIYTCTKELAINGLKANLKRIYFEENKLDINITADYEAGMQDYKKCLTEEMATVYGRIAKNKRIFVQITFFHTLHGIRIEVINNSSITSQEERRLREKLSKVMEYEDLMDFYMANADDTEGAGMGLALIVTLLKKVGIDPNLFRIIIKPDHTLARLEIPFNKNYVPVREANTGLGFI